MKIPETTLQDIDREVADEVENNSDDRIDVAYLVAALISRHQDVTGGDADYALCTMYWTVRQRVDAYVRRVKKVKKETWQTLPGLEGYVHLQERYVINSVLVKIDALTDEEFDQKIEEHYTAGDGHYAHGAELARYRTELRARQAAAQMASYE